MVLEQEPEGVLLKKIIASTIDRLSMEDMKAVLVITVTQMDTEEVRRFIIDNLKNHSHALGRAVLAMEGKEHFKSWEEKGKSLVTNGDDGDDRDGTRSDVSRKRKLDVIDMSQTETEDPKMNTTSSPDDTPTSSMASASTLPNVPQSMLVDWAAENSSMKDETPCQQESRIANLVIHFCNAYDSIIQDLCRNEDPKVIPGYIVRLGTLAGNMLDVKRISRRLERKFLVGQVMNKLRDTMVTICRILTKKKAKDVARGLGDKESKEVREHLFYVDRILSMRLSIDVYDCDIGRFIAAF